MRTRSTAMAGLLLAAAAGGPALAQGRPQAPALACAAAAGLVRTQGAVVLGTGGDTYDRYVSGQGGCEVSEYAEAAFVPTRDRAQCFVGYRCRLRTTRSTAE